jgi:hypothetical protein
MSLSSPQNRSGHKRATSRYARMKRETTKPRMYSRVIAPPYRRSHPRANAHEIAKNATVTEIKITSAIGIAPELVYPTRSAMAVPVIRLEKD